MPSKNSKEYAERKDLIDVPHQRDTEKHQMRMRELEFMRESDKIRHDQEMERQRIKSAEIRKMQDRKELSRMGGRY